jgi:hypothetical protein
MSDLLAETLADTLADPAIGGLGTAVLMAVVALWLAAAWWAYTDASRRTESSLAGFVAAGWIILSTPALLPLSLAAYAFARPQVPAADQRTRALAAALVASPTEPACGACGETVETSWLRCPRCTAWLASPCAHCGGWSEASLEVCPFCGGEARRQPFVDGPSGTAGKPRRARRRHLAWRAASPTVLRSQLRDGQRPSPAPGSSRATGSRIHS